MFVVINKTISIDNFNLLQPFTFKLLNNMIKILIIVNYVINLIFVWNKLQTTKLNVFIIFPIKIIKLEFLISDRCINKLFIRFLSLLF